MLEDITAVLTITDIITNTRILIVTVNIVTFQLKPTVLESIMFTVINVRIRRNLNRRINIHRVAITITMIITTNRFISHSSHSIMNMVILVAINISRLLVKSKTSQILLIKFAVILTI